jgi:hypothetical protein
MASLLGGCNLAFESNNQAAPDGAIGSTDGGKTDDGTTSDFDGDAVPDVRDPCPLSADHSDKDLDGLPDACDLRPATKSEPKLQCVLMFRGFSQGLLLSQELKLPPVSAAKAFQVVGTMVAIGSAPHVEFRLNQGAAAWDGIAVAMSDNTPQTGLAGELRSSSAQNASNRITTTNSAGVPDLFAWSAGDLRLQGQFNTSMFDATYQMLGQSVKGPSSRAEPIPTGGGWWNPAVAGASPAVTLSGTVAPSVFVENATYQLKYVIVTGDCL